MPTWNSASDWDTSTAEDGVVHESVANTDHDDDTIVKQGYDYANFSEITPDPIFCVPLHEDSGSTANDLVSSNNGTINGATVGQTGILGTSSYSFDGVDDNIDFGDASLFERQTSGTVTTYTCWLYLNSEQNSRVADKTFEWSIHPEDQGNSSGSVAARFDTFGDNTLDAASDTDIPIQEWVFCAWTVDAGTEIGFYRNGSSIYTDPVTDTSTADEESFRIGINFQEDAILDGRLFDFRMYESILSQTQIQTLYDVVDTAGTLTTDYRSG